jgi:hypothetical protein
MPRRTIGIVLVILLSLAHTVLTSVLVWVTHALRFKTCVWVKF